MDRSARRLLAEAFLRPELLRGTSLRQRHAARWILVDYDVENGHVIRIRFGILRHPRPYAFSKQSHNVVEYWVYDVDAGHIRVTDGVNLTRREGKDAD